LEKDENHLFSFINKIELKIPNNTINTTYDKQLSPKEKSNRNKFMRKKQMQLQNPIKNVYFTNNSSINSSDDELIEVSSTSGLIKKKHIRGNCFLLYDGFFYNLELIKWPGTNRYIL